jgi:hypothetical protein
MDPLDDLTENRDEKAQSAGRPRPLHERVSLNASMGTPGDWHRRVTTYNAPRPADALS